MQQVEEADAKSELNKAVGDQDKYRQLLTCSVGDGLWLWVRQQQHRVESDERTSTGMVVCFIVSAIRYTRWCSICMGALDSSKRFAKLARSQVLRFRLPLTL